MHLRVQFVKFALQQGLKNWKYFNYWRYKLLNFQIIDVYMVYFMYFRTIKNPYAMEDNKDLNRIKVMLAEKKRTNKWLAEQLGVNAATVSKWCTNSSQPSLDMLSKIAEALKVDYTELVRIKRIHGEEE